MCITLRSDLYCANFKCPHNLFWEELPLDREKIQMTDRAIEIRNCCCLIKYPWTPDEIGDAWGLTPKTIMLLEEEALRSLQKKILTHGKRRLPKHTVNRKVVAWT